MGNTIQDLCNEELHGEWSYTFEDNVQGSACDFGYNPMSKERSEFDIRKGDEEAQVQENSKQHEKGNKQANGL